LQEIITANPTQLSQQEYNRINLFDFEFQVCNPYFEKPGLFAQQDSDFESGTGSICWLSAAVRQCVAEEREEACWCVFDDIWMAC
jgi:hypothetical protein